MPQETATLAKIKSQKAALAYNYKIFFFSAWDSKQLRTSHCWMYTYARFIFNSSFEINLSNS